MDTQITFDLDAFKAKVDSISIQAIAQETIRWATVHVEDYLDNQQNMFRLYFPKDQLAELPEALKLHDLYQEIPEVQEDHPAFNDVVKAIEYVHLICKNVQAKMNSEKSLMDDLFKRLIFYYDMKILRKDGKDVAPIIYDLEGYVHVGLFDYEGMSQTVEVTKIAADDPTKREKIKEIVLPEGYGVELTLHFWPKTMTTSFGL